MHTYGQLSWRRRRDKTLEGDSPEGLRKTVAVFDEMGFQANHPMKLLALAWGSLGEGAARGFGDKEDEKTRFQNLIPVKVVGEVDLVNLEAGWKNSDLKTMGLMSVSVGLVRTDEKFSMHQTHSAASMLCSHDREKEWRECSFVYDHDAIKFLSSEDT
jgi:hypothetical protein